MKSHKGILFVCLLTIMFSSIFLPGLSNADPLDNWHWRSPLPRGNDLYGVIYRNGRFLAAGGSGTVLTSHEGVTWTIGSSGTTQELSGVTYGNETFVVVGGSTILQSAPLPSPPITLALPPDGNNFNACSLISMPAFPWNVSEDNFEHFTVQFSPDNNFTSTSVDISVKGPITQLTLSSDAWREITMIPGVSGGTIYWRVVGTRADGTTETSYVRPLVIGNDPVGDPTISPTGRRSKPTLACQTNCNTKFMVVFGSDRGFAKKIYTFEIENPTGIEGTFSKTLSLQQWMRIKMLVENKKGSTIYWHIESWDELERYAKTDVMSLVLTD